jgi:inositol-pentakisphosphate 2-kinase
LNYKESGLYFLKYLYKTHAAMECTIHISGKEYALAYLAEGAANVVYKLRPYHPDLLRLRKARSTITYGEIVYNFKTIVCPLFPEDALIHPRLFKLPDAEVLIPRLNEMLREKEADASRSEMRKGAYLATDEEHGIFVQDMSPRHKRERFIEFKPKWLIQSPSAPGKAKRCRTCALREMRRAGRAFSGRGSIGCCPLDLLSSDDDVLDDLFGSLAGDDLGLVKQIFKNKIHPHLIRLKSLQIEHNRVGLAEIGSERVCVPSREVVDEHEKTSETFMLSDILIGMMLRDCSVFIRYNIDEPVTKAEVKLADLDMKSAKLEKWAAIETQLIDGGWYTGTENTAGERERRFCRALQRS